MKLDMPTDMPDISLRSQNQKMAELRKGSWMLALEKEQLSRHVAYSPAHEEMNPDMQRDLQPSSDQRNVRADTFLPSVSAIEKASRLQSMPLEDALLNDMQTMCSGLSRGAVANASPLTQPFLASGRVVESQKLAMKDEITPIPSEQVTMEQESQDHAARQMHLYEKDGMVQVWIRDGNLQEASLVPVVQAIKSELKEGGKELAMLTINGKKVDGMSSQTSERHGDHVVLQSGNDRE